MSAVYLPQVGIPPSIELLPPSRLMVDESYQRSITGKSSQDLISRIARQWDWRLCVPLLVSRRDGGLYVIDGQHRLEGARRRADIPYLPCCVSDYGSPAEEATIFVQANAKRRAIGRVDQWRARLIAGDADALAVDRVISTAGLALVNSSLNGLQPGQINALGVVSTAVARFGEATAAEALTVLATAHREAVIPRIGIFLGALGEMLRRQETDASAARELIATRTFGEWRDEALADPDTARGGTYAERAMRAVLIAALATLGDDQEVGDGPTTKTADVTSTGCDPVTAPAAVMPPRFTSWAEKYAATVRSAIAHLKLKGFSVTRLSGDVGNYAISGWTGAFSDHQLIELAKVHGFQG